MIHLFACVDVQELSRIEHPEDQKSENGDDPESNQFLRYTKQIKKIKVRIHVHFITRQIMAMLKYIILSVIKTITWCRCLFHFIDKDADWPCSWLCVYSSNFSVCFLLFVETWWYLPSLPGPGIWGAGPGTECGPTEPLLCKWRVRTL